MSTTSESPVARKLSLLVEHFPMAVLLETADRKVSHTNQAFCDMFGIPAPPEALIGADCTQAAVELAPLWGDLDAFLARVAALLEARRPVVGERIELTDGRVLERDFIMLPLDDGRGEATWIYRDVTPRETARRDAEAQAQARSEILATLSHDVRTPIVGLVGLVDLLLQESLDPRIRELVEGVRDSVSGLTTLLDGLLDLARAEAGRLQLTFDDVDVCDLIEDVTAMVGPLAQAKSLPLIAAATPLAPAMVRSDPGRLRQILLNLVTNAVKFTATGAVTLLAEYSGDGELVFQVSDTGPGMPADVLDSVYERFVQADADVHRVHGGAGLGLAITREVAESLGGRIEVVSAHGRGTTFTVSLPGAPDPQSSPPPHTGPIVHVRGNPAAVPVVHAALRRMGADVRGDRDDPDIAVEMVVVTGVDEAQLTPPPRAGRRLVILLPSPVAVCPPVAGDVLALPWTRSRLVRALYGDGGELGATMATALPPGTRVLMAEDDPSNRRVLAEMLTRLGADVVAVSNGLEAVDAVAADRFDVVLTDLSMPVMDGWRAASMMHSRLGAGRCPPILALTAREELDPAILRGSGFIGSLAKPVTSARISEVIGHTLGVARATGSVPDATESTPVKPGVDLDAPVDVSVLRDLVSDLGDVGVVVETLDVYLGELPSRLDAVRAASAAGRSDKVHDLAHALKSSSEMLGARALAGLCRDLEMSTAADSRALTPSGAELSPLVDALIAQAQRVAEWMADLRRRDYGALRTSATSGA